MSKDSVESLWRVTVLDVFRLSYQGVSRFFRVYGMKVSGLIRLPGAKQRVLGPISYFYYHAFLF